MSLYSIKTVVTEQKQNRKKYTVTGSQLYTALH